MLVYLTVILIVFTSMSAGNKELLDTICDIDLRYNYSFGNLIKKIRFH